MTGKYTYKFIIKENTLTNLLERKLHQQIYKKESTSANLLK